MQNKKVSLDLSRSGLIFLFLILELLQSTKKFKNGLGYLIADAVMDSISVTPAFYKNVNTTFIRKTNSKVSLKVVEEMKTAAPFWNAHVAKDLVYSVYPTANEHRVNDVAKNAERFSKGSSFVCFSLNPA
ncbi:hypothetical protein AWH48_00770 [Domibacillus aminovorans]|uniref:Uncharacterized protein n=2 Tax=Bacillales TaxID=1385 RepID=A0A177L4I8_9BACI|nr:hypothetical protein AWH48_00770 [Domibacillus aminovorans]